MLHGLSLAVAPGEHVAVVGRTGAGKSTLLSLLAGLYPPWTGQVRLAGRDPRGLTDQQRRALVGVVPPTVQLFSATLRDNLTLADRSIPDDAVGRALALAGLTGLVTSWPAGYDTVLAGAGRTGGVALSAGQRQLVALARALVADPAVLLLDEATAASDAAFRAALRATAPARGAAVLTVAHRLSTARDADRVLVIEAGRITEQGRPADLIAAGGRFAALVALDDAGWDWDETTTDSLTPNPASQTQPATPAG